MAQKASRGSLPCLFCGKGFRSTRALTTHLDVDHDRWVQVLMTRLGLASPSEYPIEEYRLALAEALLQQRLLAES